MRVGRRFFYDGHGGQLTGLFIIDIILRASMWASNVATSFFHEFCGFQKLVAQLDKKEGLTLEYQVWNTSGLTARMWDPLTEHYTNCIDGFFKVCSIHEVLSETWPHLTVFIRHISSLIEYGCSALKKVHHSVMIIHWNKQLWTTAAVMTFCPGSWIGKKSFWKTINSFKLEGSIDTKLKRERKRNRPKDIQKDHRINGKHQR